MGRGGNKGGNGGGNNRGGNNRGRNGGDSGGGNRGGNGGGNGAGSKTCNICNKPGHVAEKCFNNPNSADYKGNGNQNQSFGGNNNHANNKGRNSNVGNNNGGSNNGSKQPSRPCKHCNEQGHWDSGCPNLGNGNQNQIQIQYQNQNQNHNGKKGLRPCRNCGDMHMDRDCPQNNGGNRNQGNDNRNNNQPRALFHNGQEPALDRPCHHCQGNHYSNKCPNNGSNQNSGYVNQRFTQGNGQMYEPAVNTPWSNPRQSNNFEDFDEEYSLSDTPQGFQSNNLLQQQQQFQNQGFQTQYNPQQFQYQGQQQMQQIWGAYPDSYYIAQCPTIYRDGAQGCRREVVRDRDGDVVMLDGWLCSSNSNGAYCGIEEPLHRPLW